MAGNEKNFRMKIIKSNRRNFDKIFNAVIVSEEYLTKPMISYEDPILGLDNPYSEATCLILYLYSMELGSPQLYAEANRVARDMDLTHLKELGPFLSALRGITFWSERNKNTGDKVAEGSKLSDIKFNMGGSFLLCRGAPMKDEWVNPYLSTVG